MAAPWTTTCGGSPTATQTGNNKPVVVGSLRLDQDSLRLYVGDTLDVVATALDENQNPVAPSELPSGIKWTSSDAGIASVDSAGRVRGADQGVTTVTASVGTVSASATVVVRDVPATLAPDSGTSITAVAGHLLDIHVTVEGAPGQGGLGVPGVPVRFTALGGGGVTSDSVVSDASGVASTGWRLGPDSTTQRLVVEAVPGSTPLAAPGSGPLAAPTHPPVSDTITAAVRIPASITLRAILWKPTSTAGEVDTAVFNEGDTLTAIGPSGSALWAIVSDRDGATIDGESVVWSSADTMIAQVYSGEYNLGAQGPGTTTITATDQPDPDAPPLASTLIYVHVRVPTTVVISPDSLHVTVGDTATVSATTLDQDGVAIPGETVEWSCADSSIVHVELFGGRVVGVTPGTTVVYGSTSGARASIPVVVVEPSRAAAADRAAPDRAADFGWGRRTGRAPEGARTRWPGR
ncbi:MAG: Ig-like domain-containing protein [Gemmatimonadetes bacterium]|nr:Ig-like domain-containing protein [Gemmatimonadota bacterium]